MTDLFIALLGGVVGLVGGYMFGVLRALNERRNERRDAALAEIFKEMSFFYRYLVSWTDDDPSKPTAESSGIPARKHVREQYNKFTYTFHDANAIWLGKDTHDLIQEFSIASRDFLNELEHIRANAGVWRLPDGTDPKDRRKERITPKFYKVRDVLRDEVETSRHIIPIPYRRSRSPRGSIHDHEFPSSTTTCSLGRSNKGGVSPAKERHQLYKILRLKVIAHLNCEVELTGALVRIPEGGKVGQGEVGEERSKSVTTS